MKPQDFLKEMNRMCKSYDSVPCENCPLDTLPCDMDMAEMNEDDYAKIYNAVAKWADEHPAKTRQSEFLKHYPNAFVCENFLHIDPCLVDKSIKENRVCYFFDCETCRRKYWLEPIESEAKQNANQSVENKN